MDGLGIIIKKSSSIFLDLVLEKFLKILEYGLAKIHGNCLEKNFKNYKLLVLDVVLKKF